MRGSLAEYLDFLLADAPDELIGAGQHGRIAALAARMLPVPRIAVECRLAAGDDQVDIQQCLRRDDGEFAMLAGYADDLASAFPQERSLARLRDFCATLACPASPLYRGIEEIYLEYDLPSGADAPNVPAVFISLPDETSMARDVVAIALTQLYGEDVAHRLNTSIDRCFEAADGDAYVSHMGFLLSRPLEIVRVNVKGLRPSQLGAFLSHCEWPGTLGDAARLFDEAVNRVDRVTVALDVGRALLPRIGVECFLDEPPARDPSWRVCFNELCDEALCVPQKAEAFLAVPAETLPASHDHPWPIALVMESLDRAETEFSCFARRAVHFKITETRGTARDAKAYFGAGHLWVSPAVDAASRRWRPTLATPRPRRSVRVRHAVHDPIARALDRGVAFLLHQQLQSGLWRDFNVPSGISDEWVSGFIGAQLVLTGEARARDAADECFVRLEQRQRANGGWGYNRDHPPDADSSSWVLRLAAALGQGQSDAARRGREFVARHCTPGGGVASYVEKFAMAPHANIPSAEALLGMLIVHDCVTGAAVPFVPDSACAYLRGRQADGRWVGYFWIHDSYATALAVEALRARPAAGDERRLVAAESRAMDWLRDAPAQSTAFDAACCLRILSGATSAPQLEARDAGCARLLEQQQADGSWMQGARLRIPLTGSITPERGPELVTIDDRRSFTTAAVIGALASLDAVRNVQGAT